MQIFLNFIGVAAEDDLTKEKCDDWSGPRGICFNREY